MSLKYNKVLVLGATSGIGEALAAKFVETGTAVIVTGRRKENLDAFVKNYGSKGSVDSAVFDITDLQSIPSFVESMFKKHPDLDCIFLNSGIQRGLDWTKPESVDLDTVELEFKTNYLSYMHFVKAALPYLQKQKKETSMIFTTSGLALIPIMGCPNYCASKAALHHMILVMRQQLKDADSNVKIVELFPPAVQTELHDEKHQPQIKNGREIGMPLKDFVEEAFEGLSADKDQVPVQMVRSHFGFDTWEQERQESFHKVAAMMKGK